MSNKINTSAAKKILKEVLGKLDDLQDLGYQVTHTLNEKVDHSVELHEIDFSLVAVRLDKEKLPQGKTREELVEKAFPLGVSSSSRSSYPLGLK